MTTRTTVGGGRVAHGLAQTLGIWLVAAFAALRMMHPALAWACLGAGLLASILLGQWHQRRSQPDTAVGAFTGAALWPVLMGAALLAINLASTLMYDFE